MFKINSDFDLKNIKKFIKKLLVKNRYLLILQIGKNGAILRQRKGFGQRP